MLAALLCAFLLCQLFAAEQKEEKPKKVSDTWEAFEPDLGADRPKATAKITKAGRVILRNRGYILSKQAHKECAVDLWWTWEEGPMPDYPDHLTIAIRTDGKVRSWPGEIREGIVVKYNPSEDGFVQILEYKADEAKPRQLARKPCKGMFERDEPVHLRVEDHGDKIIAMVNGEEILRADVPKPDGATKKAVSNREGVAGPKRSAVTDPKIELLNK